MVWTAWPRVELSEPHSREQRRSAGRGRSESTAELLEPRFVVRLRARASRLKLDRALAGGADPSASPLLAARAAQLVDPSTRKRIAGCLEQFAFTADRPPSRVKTLPLRGAVRPNQDALLHIARTLRDGQLQYARGIAMLELVLADGAGPAYTDPTGDGLAHQLALAVQALTGMAGACLVGAVG
jgi:hypothetical protein